MIQAGKISICLIDFRIGWVMELSKKFHNYRTIYEINYIGIRLLWKSLQFSIHDRRPASWTTRMAEGDISGWLFSMKKLDNFVIVIVTWTLRQTCPYLSMNLKQRGRSHDGPAS